MKNTAGKKLHNCDYFNAFIYLIGYNHTFETRSNYKNYNNHNNDVKQKINYNKKNNNNNNTK